MEEELTRLKDEILESFKAQVGAEWDKMVDQDKALLEDLARDAARLHVKALTSDTDIDKEIAIVNASLVNMGVARILPAQKAFWNAVEHALVKIASTLVRAGIAALV